MKSLYMFLFVWPLVFSCELATKWRDLNNNKIKDPTRILIYPLG